jgi:tetratricopeptide (TPR) repeat protein
VKSSHDSILRMEIREALVVGDTQQALALSESLQGDNPSAENLRLNVGILWRAGEKALAVEKLEDWLRLHPRDQEVRTYLAESKVALGDTEEARKLYESALSDGDYSAKSLNNLAYLLLDSDPVRALELANRAVELNPRSAQILDTRAWAEHANGRDQAALQTATRALNMAPASSELQWSKIQFQIEVGINEDALVALQDLLEGHPEKFPGRESAVQELERLGGSL